MIEQQQQQEARTWAMLAHLSALSMLFTGFGGILGPLIVWLIKKDQLPFVNDQGKEAINFHLTMLIAYVALGLLTCVTIGFGALITVPLMIVVAIVELVFSIIAAVQANQGVAYRYPLTIRMIK